MFGFAKYDLSLQRKPLEPRTVEVRCYTAMIEEEIREATLTLKDSHDNLLEIARDITQSYISTPEDMRVPETIRVAVRIEQNCEMLYDAIDRINRLTNRLLALNTGVGERQFKNLFYILYGEYEGLHIDGDFVCYKDTVVLNMKGKSASHCISELNEFIDDNL